MHQIDHKSSFDASPVALLYDRYAHIILRVVSRFAQSQEDAHDLVLEVFIAAMESATWLNLSQEEQLAWLRRVAHNKGVDHYRRHTRYQSVSIDVGPSAPLLFEDDERMPEHITLRNEEHAMLRENISRLSELQQEIVHLRFGHGLRTKEIAQRLNKSDGLVRVLLSRAINYLRGMYRQQEGAQQ
ncbi:RNA polymerase sigma factor [Dictyobacter aurantiacus]|nr:sigma-70 family RNA polymerase sigma factor [Dictyobacter aurantiacus]